MHPCESVISILAQFDMPDRHLNVIVAVVFGLPTAIGVAWLISIVFRKNVKTVEALALAVYVFMCCMA